MASATLQWTKITDTKGPAPTPKHGHRAVVIKDLIIVYGGGNQGIIDELRVYNTSINEWFIPEVTGQKPDSRAAHGFTVYGTSRILMFGGIIEYGKLSNELYELQASRWIWRKLRPRAPKFGILPFERLGHSFTTIGDRIFLFGGLTNYGLGSTNCVLRCLNDLYVLKMNPVIEWEIFLTNGTRPSPRESHTSVTYYDPNTLSHKLIIYGGRDINRLGDLHVLDIRTKTWYTPEIKGIPPISRSLHSAVIIDKRMIIFGGWVPKSYDGIMEWKCSDYIASFNLDKMAWEETKIDNAISKRPTARAGHCAVNVNNRMFVWSGRDGEHIKLNNNKVNCRDDLWCLEIKAERPSQFSNGFKFEEQPQLQPMEHFDISKVKIENIIPEEINILPSDSDVKNSTELMTVIKVENTNSPPSTSITNGSSEILINKTPNKVSPSRVSTKRKVSVSVERKSKFNSGQVVKLIKTEKGMSAVVVPDVSIVPVRKI